jgi:ADP-ribosylglycohydrolase
MRVAPVGLSNVADPFLVAAEAAAITHGHPSGYLAAGFLGDLIARLRSGEALADAIDETRSVLASHPGHEEVARAVDAAVDLAGRGRPSGQRLETLGGGWVAEEALAISICCALVAEDVLDGLLLAVNHSGDSDSTGAIAGNILGTIRGEHALPADLLEALELREVITQVADDLVDAFWDGGAEAQGGRSSAFGGWVVRYPSG